MWAAALVTELGGFVGILYARRDAAQPGAHVQHLMKQAARHTCVSISDAQSVI
jgi:hypothetical protein